MQVNKSFWRNAICACLPILFSLITPAALSQSYLSELPGGVVPNQAVACAVAKVYLSEVYGKANIESQLPLVATLQGKVWTVKGTFNRKHSVGGVAEIDIAREDGRVLRLIHTM